MACNSSFFKCIHIDAYGDSRIKHKMLTEVSYLLEQGMLMTDFPSSYPSISNYV